MKYRNQNVLDFREYTIYIYIKVLRGIVSVISYYMIFFLRYLCDVTGIYEGFLSLLATKIVSTNLLKNAASLEDILDPM